MKVDVIFQNKDGSTEPWPNVPVRNDGTPMPCEGIRERDGKRVLVRWDYSGANNSNGVPVMNETQIMVFGPWN